MTVLVKLQFLFVLLGDKYLHLNLLKHSFTLINLTIMYVQVQYVLGSEPEMSQNKKKQLSLSRD